jgi:hypothetical protein
MAGICGSRGGFCLKLLRLLLSTQLHDQEPTQDDGSQQDTGKDDPDCQAQMKVEF